MTKQHSAFGGSQASRYMACPGSIRLSQKAPVRPASTYADEGTFAHSLAEMCLNAGFKPAASFIGLPVAHSSLASVKEVTEEMAQAVQVYLDAIAEDYDEETCEIEIEQRFGISLDAAPDGEVFGTNDCLVYNRKTRKLTNYDYKHGAGVVVEVADNKQFKFYLTGAVQAHPEWEIGEIEFVVVQPRAVNAGETLGVHRWSLPLFELLDFPDALNDAIAEALGPNPHFEAGEHCRWCPAATICTVREQAFIVEACGGEVSVDDFSLVDLAVEDLPPTEDFEHMGRVIEAYEALGEWVNQLRDRRDEYMFSGGDVAGRKVVEKVARRKWVAEGEEVASYLALNYEVPDDLVLPRKLETIAEVKRLMKSFIPKEQYAEAEKDLTLRFTTKEASGLTTAPVSDKRPAIMPIAAEFGSVQLGSED